MEKLTVYDGSRPNRSKQRGDTSVVYALVDPRDGAVRYIGITNNVLERFKEHMRMYGGNERKNAWLQELVNAHMLPYMRTLEVVEVESAWREREVAWIEAYQESGAVLLNDEAHRGEEVPMEEHSNQKNKQSTRRLSLVDLPDYRLGPEGDLNGFDATDSEFLNFVQSLVPLTGEGLDHWTWEERRDFLNWCLDEQVLTIQDGRLVPVEEHIPTAPLTHDIDAEAQKNAEEGA